MPLEESLYPQDWFAKAVRDVRTVEILLREEGDAQVAGFHLQQAVEKYLKGYLLSQGFHYRTLFQRGQNQLHRERREGTEIH